ncbi:MAG: hypothetical protein HRT77_03650 [Halioglobus sp.]|nr:hypothetical protein [Halioglobus sp.]
MSSFRDKQSGAGMSDRQPTQSGTISRRRFSRRALAGGAVLASLGNRSAWGQTVVGCMSVTTIASFNPSTGMFVSAPGGRPEHDETLAAEIHEVSVPFDGDYLGSGPGTDGVTIYSTCEDPVELDVVCLVEGPACPP